jgi:hypothetical protein
LLNCFISSFILEEKISKTPRLISPKATLFSSLILKSDNVMANDFFSSDLDSVKV